MLLDGPEHSYPGLCLWDLRGERRSAGMGYNYHVEDGPSRSPVPSGDQALLLVEFLPDDPQQTVPTVGAGRGMIRKWWERPSRRFRRRSDTLARSSSIRARIAAKSSAARTHGGHPLAL